LIYCTVYNPAIDIIYTLDELQPGRIFTDVSAESTPAGKGINVAKVVRTLGEDVTVVGLMPEEDKERFSRFLEDWSIHSYFYSVEGAVRVNTTITEKITGHVTHISSADYRLSTRIQDEFQGFLESRMHEGDVWALSGSIPQGFDSDAYMKLIQIGKKKNIFIMLDSRGLAFNMGVRAKPHMVKPNLTELEAFFGEQVEGVHHIALKGKRLSDMGIEYVFISLGADGMIAIHEDECLLCSVPSVDVVDTVGCGDALVAGLLVARTRKFSFIEACRIGIACGTSNALHAGPGIVDNDEIWRLMEDVRIEAV
jgi:tagatose 6-phosphate kinase